MTSSSFPKSSGDPPPPPLPASVLGGRGCRWVDQGVKGVLQGCGGGMCRWLVPPIQKKSIAPVPSRGRQEAVGSTALEMVACGDISQHGSSCGFATPVAEMWVLGRGVAEGAWFLKLRGDKRSVHEGISAFDILPFVSCCREAGAGIGL